MREIRLLACLLSLFITSNSSVCAMTAVEQGSSEIKTDVSENENVSSGKDGRPAKGWGKLRSFVKLGKNVKRADDFSKVSQSDSKESEEDFDDTETIFEEEDFDDAANIKSEKGGLKRSDSNATLYEESIDFDSDDQKSTVKKEEDSNNEGDIKSEKAANRNESIRSGRELWSIVRDRKKSESRKSFFEDSENATKKDNDKDSNEGAKSDLDEKKATAENNVDLKDDVKLDLEDEEEDSEEAKSDIDEKKIIAEKDKDSKRDEESKKAISEIDSDLDDEEEDSEEAKSGIDEKKVIEEKDKDSRKDEESKKAISEIDSDSDDEDDDLDDVTDTKSEDATSQIRRSDETEARVRKSPTKLKIPINMSGIQGLRKSASRLNLSRDYNRMGAGTGIYDAQIGGRSDTFSGNYRRVYTDGGSGIYDARTVGRRNTFSEGSVNKGSSLAGRLKRSLSLASLGGKLSNDEGGGDGDSGTDDSGSNDSETQETETEEAETPLADVSSMQMPTVNAPVLPMQQQIDPNMMQNPAQSLVANGNLNNQMNMQQMPYQIQNMVPVPANVQNTMPIVSNSSSEENNFMNMMQNFLQDSDQQNTSNSEFQTKRSRKNRLFSSVQNMYGSGKNGIRNMYRSGRNKVFSGIKSVATNLKDSEVVEKVIRYLRDLGVINESKFVKLNLKDIGTCIYCKRFSLLTMLDKEKKLGACGTCSKQLVNDYLAGKSLGGDRYEANGYRRDSGVDISDSMVREEAEKNKSLFSKIGGVFAQGANALFNKGSSSNPNEQMGQNAFGQPIPMQNQIVGGEFAQGQLVPMTAMPLDQTQMLNAGTGSLVGGAALGQVSGLGMDPSISGQMSNLGMDPSMGAMGTTGTGTGILSNIGKYGKVAAGVALGTAALGAGVAAWKALKSKKKGTTTEQQMVLNEKGELVPLSSWNNADAPYGYKVDPATGDLVPAASAEEGLAFAQEVAAAQEAATQEAANNTETGASSGSSKLKTAAKVAAGVAAGAAAVGAGVAAFKAWKKSKSSDKKESKDKDDKKDTNAAKNGEDKKTETSDKKDSSSEAQKDASNKLSPEEREKVEDKIKDLEHDIKEVQEKIKSTEEEKQEKQKEYDDYKAKGKKGKMRGLKKEIERLDESLKKQKENLEELQKDQKALKEKLGGSQSKSEPNKAA